MQREIKRLGAELANQIAAGEVIENPAAIVKELVENSIDAGAHHVEIMLEQGGKSLIRITDDGCGIGKKDLPLALERHATSKIASFDDLCCVKSMGFRGEALASIASVSRLRLISKPADEAIAYQLSVDGESSIKPKLAPYQQPIADGTIVEVWDLFFRVPAREKFLSSVSSELRKVREVVKKLILAHPTVTIELYHGAKKLYDVHAAASIEQASSRVKAIFGDEFIQHSLFMDERVQWGRIVCWCAKPVFTRSQADMQYFFINNRPIKDRHLSFSLKRAYQDIIMQSRYPAYCVYLFLDPTSVDMNVHPSKEQVRFEDVEGVTRALRHSVMQLFRDTTSATALPVFNTSANTFTEKMPSVEVVHRETSFLQNRPGSPSPSDPPAVFTERQHVVPMRSSISSTSTSSSVDVAVDLNEVSSETIASAVINENKPAMDLGFAIGQLHGIYILAQAKNSMIIVDMHAAHERILYESLKEAYRAQGVPSQQLIVPLEFTSTSEIYDYAKEHALLLQQLGFHLQFHDNQLITITHVPAMLNKLAMTELLDSVIAECIHFHGSDQMQQALDKVFATMACHQAIRANRILSVVEMNALLRKIERTSNSNYCNHGRPTWFVWSLDKIDAVFHRGS